MSLIFMANAFYIECHDGQQWYDTLGEYFFAIVRLLILAYFVVEYVVSIMENLAVIDGKPKTMFIDAVKSLLSSMIDVMKTKISGH